MLGRLACSALVRFCWFVKTQLLTIPVMATEMLMYDRDLSAQWLIHGATDRLRVNAHHGTTQVLKLAHFAELYGTNVELNHQGGLYGLIQAQICADQEGRHMTTYCLSLRLPAKRLGSATAWSTLVRTTFLARFLPGSFFGRCLGSPKRVACSWALATPIPTRLQRHLYGDDSHDFRCCHEPRSTHCLILVSRYASTRGYAP